MASSPVYRATPELPRPRSSHSVPAQSRDSVRSGTPGSSRSRLSFFNRSITPSIKSRRQSVAPDDPTDRMTHTKRLASQGRLLQSWSEVTERYKNIGLEDDEEIDLFSETVHRSDGSVAKWRPDRRSRRGGRTGSDSEEEDQSDGDSIQAGPSMRKHSRPITPESGEESTSTDEDDDEGSSHSETEEEEDEMGSWAVQEENFKTELADKKAALLLSSLRSAPRKTKEEDIAEFLRDEEIQRTRRMSARVEGRDSRCHTDALSDSEASEDERPLEPRRSPSRFSTMITDAEGDLFSDSESGEDELAVASTDMDVGSRVHSSVESEAEDLHEIESRKAIEFARQVSSQWTTDSSLPIGRRRISLSPDSSPEPFLVSDKRTSSAVTSSHRINLPMAQESSPDDLDETAATATSRRNVIRAKVTGHVMAENITHNSNEKGKGRMVDKRPTRPAVVDDVFGSHEIDIHTLDRRRYHRSRYRQKASQSFKTCRFCRLAEPARAKLAEYCRGANHSKQCTYEFPLESDERNADLQPVPPPPRDTTWKDDVRKTEKPAKADVPITTELETTTPAKKKRSGRTSGGLEKWRYYENLVKRPDKQTDRSCPYCRSSEDASRYENAVYCRGRIESKDCTFDGHKGSLRFSAKMRTPKQVASEPAKVVSVVHQATTPKTPSHTVGIPDTTVDEDQLDLKLYYASLIRDQTQTGYRFCVDCIRSGDAQRRRLSFWCRGRISYKACGHWDGDESRHRRRRRQSAPDGLLSKDSANDINLAPAQSHEAMPIPEEPMPRTTGGDVDRAPRPSTSIVVDNTRHVRSINSVATLYYPEVHKLGHGGVMHCKLCRSAGGRRKDMSAYCRGRTSSSRCQFSFDADTAEETDTKVEPIVKKRGRPRKSLDIPTTVPTPSIDILTAALVTTNVTVNAVQEGQQPEVVKRKRGRPRKTPVFDPADVLVPALDPVKRKPGRPKSLSTTTNPITETNVGDEHVRQVKVRSDGAETLEPMKRKDRPRSRSLDLEDTKNEDLLAGEAVTTESKTRPRPGWARARKTPSTATRPRSRSRTFDIVVPISRSSTSPRLSPTVASARRDKSGLAVPISSMRNCHSQQISPSLIDLSARRVLNDLPPSSPPASSSPSASPRPIHHLPFRSSPLASVRPRNRTSTARSETPSMPIKGILRQSSEFSDTPRSNKRIRFSLMRSPSPIEVDSESSDDELLLVAPSSTSRQSAPPSSHRHGSSSPYGPESRYVESPQTGRLSSSMLAAYAPTLDRVPTLGSSSSMYTPPQRSTLSSPPINADSAHVSRGMMRPPPVPSKGTPTPHSEPRPREDIRRAHTVGPAHRPRSSTFSAKSSDRPVAENMVIRRLINDVR